MLSSPLALAADRRYRQLPGLPAKMPERPMPSLSIIVPARNEETNLRRLLPSLSSLTYSGPLETIVIDDDSSDDTARVAEELGARVVSLSALPAGWLGKPYACHQGALRASGDWLLFTDADTVHDPSGPALAVSYAESMDLDGLSLLPQQSTGGIGDGVALAVAFAGLFAGTGKNHSHLNGQFVLIRRAIYEESGGFAVVAGQTLEDLALGRHLTDNGYRMQLIRGEHAVQVRMYRNWRSLWRGLTRIAAGSLPWSGRGSLKSIALITTTVAPVFSLASALGQRRHGKWALASWAVVIPGFLPWAQRFGSRRLAFFAPAGALIVQLAALWGMANRVLGRGVRWKGRRV